MLGRCVLERDNVLLHKIVIEPSCAAIKFACCSLRSVYTDLCIVANLKQHAVHASLRIKRDDGATAP